MCKSSFLHFKKKKRSFGEIAPKAIKGYQVLCHNRYILLQLGGFYQNFDRKTTYCGKKFTNIICGSLQDVFFWYKIVQICIFYICKFTHFCNLDLKTKQNLKAPVQFRCYKITTATHSTIVNNQHREFLTSFSIYCFSTTHVYLTIHVTLEAINCSI